MEPERECIHGVPESKDCEECSTMDIQTILDHDDGATQEWWDSTSERDRVALVGAKLGPKLWPELGLREQAFIVRVLTAYHVLGCTHAD